MIEIDIEFILKHNITANQFLLFRLILDGSIGTINRLYTNIPDLELDIRNLINKGFILQVPLSLLHQINISLYLPRLFL